MGSEDLKPNVKFMNLIKLTDEKNRKIERPDLTLKFLTHIKKSVFFLS